MTSPTLGSRVFIAAATVVVIVHCGGKDGTTTAPPPPATPTTITSVSGDLQSGTVNQLLPQPLIVRVTDNFAAPVAAVAVSWAVTAGGGTLSTAATQTDAQGQASVTWTLGSAPGTSNNSVQASASGLTGSPVRFTASAGIGTVYTDTASFRTATAGFGTPAIVTFEDADSTPLNNTIFGRPPFDGSHYAGQGFTFASPGGYSLYIAPGGLFWNASNSLSVGHLPFDTTQVAPTNDADSLQVTLSPGCHAVSLQFVDNGTRSPAEFVAFSDSSGNIVKQSGLPANYSGERAFIGVVSQVHIVKVLIAENANDGDDVDYDDFRCYP